MTIFEHESPIKMSLRSNSALGDRKSNLKDIKFELIKQPTNYETARLL